MAVQVDRFTEWDTVMWVQSLTSVSAVVSRGPDAALHSRCPRWMDHSLADAFPTPGRAEALEDSTASRVIQAQLRQLGPVVA